ncbi:MAG: hypothetical protein H6Q13_1858 [Bacteroidetes bacterium]|nr:hypothetical protein [Bacteroidota bacterium]
MSHIKCLNLTFALIFIGALSNISIANANSQSDKVLAHCRFEKIQHLKKDSTSLSLIGQPLAASDRTPIEPQPFVFDDSEKGNFIQVRDTNSSANVFSNNVPANMFDGMPNTRSLALKQGEYVATFDRSLAYYDMQKSWTIEASLMCNLLRTEQVYLFFARKEQRNKCLAMFLLASIICAEDLYFNPDGTIKPITLTSEGISVPPKQ